MLPRDFFFFFFLFPFFLALIYFFSRPFLQHGPLPRRLQKDTVFCFFFRPSARLVLSAALFLCLPRTLHTHKRIMHTSHKLPTTPSGVFSFLFFFGFLVFCFFFFPHVQPLAGRRRHSAAFAQTEEERKRKGEKSRPAFPSDSCVHRPAHPSSAQERSRCVIRMYVICTYVHTFPPTSARRCVVTHVWDGTEPKDSSRAGTSWNICSS